MTTTVSSVIIKSDYALVDVRNNAYEPLYATCSLEDVSAIERRRWRSRGDLGPFTTITENGIDYPLHMANYLLGIPRQVHPKLNNENPLDCRRENIVYKKKITNARPLFVNTFIKEADYYLMSPRSGKSPVKVDADDVDRLRPYYWSTTLVSGKADAFHRLYKNGAYFGHLPLGVFLLNLKQLPFRQKISFRNGDDTDYRKANIYLQEY